jgi:hypothetical protein
MLIINNIIEKISLGINKANLPPVERFLFEIEDFKFITNKTKPATFITIPKMNKGDNKTNMPIITNIIPAKKVSACFHPNVLSKSAI